MDHILTVEPPNFSCTSMLTVTQEAIVQYRWALCSEFFDNHRDLNSLSVPAGHDHEINPRGPRDGT